MDGSQSIITYLKLAARVPLTLVNYLNVVAFALTWLLNSEVDFGSEDHVFDFLSGMRELGRRYDSVVTPTENTFLMSHVVLLFLGIFTVAQLLPKYRQSPLVQEGVSYWFFASSVAQLLWCMDLGLNSTMGALLSILFMAIMLVFNCIILLKQTVLINENHEPEDFWLLRFPFSLQGGWTMSLFIMVINSFITYIGAGVHIQIIFGFLSLSLFGLISVKMLFANGQNPNFVIPSVFAWFILGFAFDNNKGNEVVQVYYGKNYYGQKYYGTKYYGTEVTQFSITSAIAASMIAITVVVLFYNQHFKTDSSDKSMNYVNADDEASTTSSENDPPTYVAPREDDEPTVATYDGRLVIV